jgi:predicted metal-dependent hydrolase
VWFVVEAFKGDPNGVMNESKDSSEELQWICRSTLNAISPSFREAKFQAVFYRYIGLTHTIRRKGSAWVIKISDHCKNAPAQVLESIVIILAYKVLRRKPPRRSVEIYEQFRKSPAIESAVRQRRLTRGRKQISHESGSHYSLAKIYREINAQYFGNRIEIHTIGWGRRKSWSRLGHFDPVHQTITVSPVLDSPKVPDFVVQYLVYHEMLHAIFQDGPKHHPPAFRKTERSYPDYARAKKFLAGYCARRRK